MHPSLSSYTQKQRARTPRREKNRASRQERRELEVLQQHQQVEVNLVRFMQKNLKTLQGESLQHIIWELSTTREITYNVNLRRSDKKSYFELLYYVVHGMIADQRILSHEDWCHAGIGLPPEKLKAVTYGHPASSIDLMTDIDWSIPVIVNCPHLLRKVLAEYA